MGQQPGRELPSELAKLVRRRAVEEQIVLAARVPDAQMDVAAVAGLIRPRLRSERGEVAVLEGDRPDRLAVQELVVGGTKGRRISDRELLLAATQLRVVL